MLTLATISSSTNLARTPHAVLQYRTETKKKEKRTKEKKYIIDISPLWPANFKKIAIHQHTLFGCSVNSYTKEVHFVSSFFASFSLALLGTQSSWFALYTLPIKSSGKRWARGVVFVDVKHHVYLLTGLVTYFMLTLFASHTNSVLIMAPLIQIAGHKMAASTHGRFLFATFKL